MTTTLPPVLPSALRLRLRSTSERSEDGSAFRGLKRGVVSEPSQKPPSVGSNIDHGVDKSATKSSSSAEDILNRQLRQARNFLRSPGHLSRDDLAERHKEIEDLLQRLEEEYGDTGGYDLELYNDVKKYLRKKPHESGFLASGKKRRHRALRQDENTTVRSAGQRLPTDKNGSIYKAHGRRSATTKANNATHLPLQKKYTTRKRATKAINRGFGNPKARGRKPPTQSQASHNTNASKRHKPIPTKSPNIDIDFLPNTPKPADPASSIKTHTHSPFPFGETTHLQALMSAQIERDLVEGSLETERGTERGTSPSAMVPATGKFALPLPGAKEVEVARVVLEGRIERGGFGVRFGERGCGVDEGGKQVRVDGGELEGDEVVEDSRSELRPVVEWPDAAVLPTRRGSVADIAQAVDEARGGV